MITKTQFESALIEIKKEYPKITILDTTFDCRPKGIIWFAYTFSQSKSEIKEMKEDLRHNVISSRANDMIDENSDKLDYQDLVSDWKYWIKDFSQRLSSEVK